MKRLYNILSSCQKEEEVKSEFAKFFRIKTITRYYKIDLYTESVLFEFKYDENFNSKSTRAKVIAQTLYYVRKLKYGTATIPIPDTICIVDKNSGFYIKTTDFHNFYNATSKYDWDRAASQPCPVLVDELKKSELISDIHLYEFSNENEEELFTEHIRVLIQEEGLLSSDKKEINEYNFESVFAYWKDLFEKYVENGHKSSEYFVSDIESGHSSVLENEVMFRLGDGSITKNIPMAEYKHFWNMYEKVQNPKVIKAIRQKIDRLSKDFSRRFTGEFYTNPVFAEKAFDYIKRTVGPDKYKKGNWRIWDMAAGTGNLEYFIESSVMDNCYISTLLEDDANYCKRIFPTATVFQYDYLNDDIFLIANSGEVPPFIKTKMPKKLLDDLHNPEISWIIFINPPYVTSNKAGQKTGKKSKDDVSMTEIRKLMTKEELGETSRELISQFLYRISKEFSDKTAYLGLFSKLKYLNANNDQKLRDDFFKYKFERGFMFHAKNFSGTSGEFPIGFLVWNLSKNKHIKEQKIVLDVYNDDCEKIGTKEMLTKERTELLSKWVTRPTTTKVFPPFSSGITVSERTNDVRNRIADDFLCSLMCCGNDIQHQRYTSLLSGPYASAGAFSVIPDNFEKSMVIHTVRIVSSHTWDKDRDQFYQPYNKDLPQEFINDCVICSAFSPSNNTVSLKDVKYNGKIYQVHNEMFPFLLKDVTSWKCGHSGISSQLFSANENRFLAKWIDEHKFSKEAKAVLTSARELYKYVYEQINTIRWLDYKIELWDIGWWQIKEAAKVMTNVEELFNDFKHNFNLLSRKILPLISEYGFLPPDVKLFNG